MTLLMEDRSITSAKAQKFGKWLRRMIRDAEYKSQQEFADASGFSRVQIQRWLAGEVRPREDNIEAIAAALSKVATLNETLLAAGYAAHAEEQELSYELTDEEKEQILSWFNGRPPDELSRAMKMLKLAFDEDDDFDEGSPAFGRNKH